MVFSWFRKKDPICGMKQENGKGFIDEETGNWFCSRNCMEEFHKRLKKQEKRKPGGCCH